MAVQHSKDLIIGRKELAHIAEARLQESRALHAKGHHMGSMFLGGCSLECYLKLAICHTLKLEGLPGAFKTHNLEALILYSGFQHNLHENLPVKRSFDQIVREWGGDGREKLLYRAPEALGKSKAETFTAALWDTNTGVIPWLRNLMS